MAKNKLNSISNIPVSSLLLFSLHSAGCAEACVFITCTFYSCLSLFREEVVKLDDSQVSHNDVVPHFKRKANPASNLEFSPPLGWARSLLLMGVDDFFTR